MYGLSFCSYFNTDKFFFGLITLLRFSFNLGLVERPLIVGLLLALFSGEWELCVGIAIFFELVWLDLFSVGTFIPPQGSLALLITFLLAVMFERQSPGQILPLLILGLPLAWLGAKVEGWQRLWNNRYYNKIAYILDKPQRELHPESLIRIALLQTFVLHTLFFAVLFVLVYTFFIGVDKVLPQTPGEIAWGHLWSAALIGGILSLRIKKAYIIFIIAVLLLLFLTFLGG